MAEFTRVLIDPSREDLTAALTEAARHANHRCRRNTLPWPPANLNRVLGQGRVRAEGHHRWEGGLGAPVSVVALAWWTDHAGRKHYRVGGKRCEERGDVDRDALFFPPQGRAILRLVYPDFVLEQARGERWEPVAVCPCGVFGPPATLGWMGTTCGPCHDRQQEGAPAPPFCQPTLHFDTWVRSLSFSPGGDLLATSTEDAVALRDPATGEERPGLASTLPGTHRPVRVAFSPAGGVLASFGRGSPLALWDFPGSRRTARKQVAADAIAFSPDGRWLAACCWERILLWEMSTRRALSTRFSTDRSRGGFISLTFSHDGRFLAATNSNHEAILWEVPSWREVARLHHHADCPGPLAFSPDGNLLAVGAHGVRSSEGDWEPQVHVWDVRNQTCLFLLDMEYPPLSLTFSPDGSRLLAGGYDCQVQVWDTGDFGPPACFVWHKGNVGLLEFSPDGRLLASGDYTGEVHLWPTEMLTGANS
jgi:WD40 repeat protein